MRARLTGTSPACARARFGESPVGTWTLRIVDDDARTGAGTLHSWELRLHGSSDDAVGSQLDQAAVLRSAVLPLGLGLAAVAAAAAAVCAAHRWRTSRRPHWRAVPGEAPEDDPPGHAARVQ